uniref:P2Y receptor family member 10 n=1 Tax=Myripristis murdjan TaxID=586833 RepID=A0A667ZLK1_9TELE
MNKSGSSGGTLGNSSSPCGHNMTSWEERMDQLYTYFYILIFVPGLLLNTIALWVLCRHISKKTKAVIFMINLALADLAHVLSLPLRIYYYFTHTWPFGNIVCLFCFYLKYLNMYASIVFLVCISLQRCVFLLNPFFARRWRRRYDLLISVVVWLVVGLGCSPFILVRIPSTTPSPPKSGCFKDLPTRQLPLFLAITIMTLGELFGFVLPLVGISYNKSLDTQADKEKRRALRMVLSCFALFLLCFAPYHLNFLLYLMVSQDIVSHCATRLAVRQFHPVSLCLASMSCCLNPLLYYFLTAEFRSHLTRRTSSFTSSLISSPTISSSRPSTQQRLMSMESFSSYRE